MEVGRETLMPAPPCGVVVAVRCGAVRHTTTRGDESGVGKRGFNDMFSKTTFETGNHVAASSVFFYSAFHNPRWRQPNGRLLRHDTRHTTPRRLARTRRRRSDSPHAASPSSSSPRRTARRASRTDPGRRSEAAQGCPPLAPRLLRPPQPGSRSHLSHHRKRDD